VNKNELVERTLSSVRPVDCCNISTRHGIFPAKISKCSVSEANECDDCVTFTVIDEADRTLDLGFAETIRSIVSNLPEERQTILFSATQTRSASSDRYDLMRHKRLNAVDRFEN
jgi:hypothetical protein